MKNLPQKVRSRKLNSRVDLTAMVSVSFLLIIFFMVTIELRKSKAMDLSLPYYDPKWQNVTHCGSGLEERVITILLDKNNKIITYSGLLYFTEKNPKIIDYGKNGIRKELSLKNKIALANSAKLGKYNRGVVVIIKPSKKSNFKNLVDILDEIAIAQIGTYAIVNDFSPEEEKLLASN